MVGTARKKKILQQHDGINLAALPIIDAADLLVPGIMAKHCQNLWLPLFL
jgi:hypothetical protein